MIPLLIALGVATVTTVGLKTANSASKDKQSGDIKMGKTGPIYNPPERAFMETSKNFDKRMEQYESDFDHAQAKFEKTATTGVKLARAEAETEASSLAAQSKASEATAATYESAAKASKAEAEASKAAAINAAAQAKLAGRLKQTGFVNEAVSETETAMPTATQIVEVVAGTGAGWLVGARIGAVGGPMGAAIGGVVGYGIGKLTDKE